MAFAAQVNDFCKIPVEMQATTGGGGGGGEEGVVAARQQQLDEDLRQSYGGTQAREVHPLEQLPPYAPVPYGCGRQDHQRYTD